MNTPKSTITALSESTRRPSRRPSPAARPAGGAAPDPTTQLVENLRRTWESGAGRITVTYPRHGSDGQWDIERGHRTFTGGNQIPAVRT